MKLNLIIIFLCGGIFLPVFSAGLRFKNDTPFALKVLVEEQKPLEAQVYGKEFSVAPGGNFSYDLGARGFQGITITACTWRARFQQTISWLTGMRDWVLVGNAVNNLMLDIGPVGLDPKIGTFPLHIRETANTCR